MVMDGDGEVALLDRQTFDRHQPEGALAHSLTNSLTHFRTHTPSLTGRGSDRFDELFRQIALLEESQRGSKGSGTKTTYPGFDLSSSSSLSSGGFSAPVFYRTWEAFGTTLGDMDFCEEDRDYGLELANSSRQARRWVEGERKKEVC